MSDEFIKIATDEINEEIAQMLSILDTCYNDSDVSNNSENLEQHLHKIKGLAPMMGKPHLGNLAAFFDSVMKQVHNGKQIDGIFDALQESLSAMNNAMTNSDLFLVHLQTKISKNISDQD